LEPLGVARLPGLAELPAPPERVPEQRVCQCRLLHLREVSPEVVLQQVFQKTRCDGVPQVFLGVPTPPAYERPHRPGVRLDVLPDPDDGLPTGVMAPVNRLAGQHCVGFEDGVLYSHVVPHRPLFPSLRGSIPLPLPRWSITSAFGGRYLASLLGDQEQIAANLKNYVAGFSPNAREIFLDKFKFGEQIDRLDEGNLLFLVVSKFAEIDLHPDVVDNHEMGYVFEELIRRFSEQSNETAGEHFTPREVIRLMVNRTRPVN
jgi:hypothetical protein